MKNIDDIMLNPVRMIIIQELSAGQSIAAIELCERMSDVPRTTCTISLLYAFAA